MVKSVGVNIVLGLLLALGIWVHFAVTKTLKTASAKQLYTIKQLQAAEALCSRERSIAYEISNLKPADLQSRFDRVFENESSIPRLDASDTHNARAGEVSTGDGGLADRQSIERRLSREAFCSEQVLDLFMYEMCINGE